MVHCDLNGTSYFSCMDVRMHMKRIVERAEREADSSVLADGVYVNAKKHTRQELDVCLWHFLPEPLDDKRILHVLLYRDHNGEY